jgi:hypothetical protein
MNGREGEAVPTPRADRRRRRPVAARSAFTAVTLTVVSVLALTGCSSSGSSTPQDTRSTSSTPQSTPTYPPGIGDMGIGTHMGSDNQAGTSPEIAKLLGPSRQFDTVYLDGRLDSTPDVPTLRSWLEHGVSPVIDLSFKNGPFTMAETAADSPAVQSYLTSFVAGLQSLARRSKALDNGTSVYFSFEHEAVAKINQGKFVFSGYQGLQPTVEDAAAAWNRVERLVAQDAPDVVRVYWYGGSAQDEDEYSDLLRPDLIQMATFDPYRWYYNSPGATAAELWGPRIDHLLSQTWMTTPNGKLKPWGLTEWGTDQKLGDANNARFVADTLAYLHSRGATFAIYFDRANGPNDFTFTGGDEPQTLAAYLKAIGTH